MSAEKGKLATIYNPQDTNDDRNRMEESASSTGSDSGEKTGEANEGGTGTRSHKGLTMWLGAFFLIGEMAGAGILSLPYAVANTGWAGVPLMAVLSVTVGYSGTRLALCWVLLENRWPEYRYPCRRPYPAIAYRALGKPGEVIAEVSMFITLFGTAIVYLLLTATYFHDLLQWDAPRLTQCAWILVIGACLTPVTMLSTPKDFWPASVVAMISTLAACLVVVISLVINKHEYDPPAYDPPTFQSFFLGFGAILFALGGASLFPTVQNDMKDRSQFPQSVIITFFVLLALYLPVATICYGILGKGGTPSNILDGVRGGAIPYVKCFILVHFLFAFTIVINPCNQTLEGLLKLPDKLSVYRVLLRVGTMAAVMLTGLAIPDFSKILNLIGGSTVAIMSFILPPLSYFRLCWAKDEDGRPYKELSWWTVGVLWVIVAVGVIGGIASTFSAVQDIVNSSLGNTCFQKDTFLP